MLTLARKPSERIVLSQAGKIIAILTVVENARGVVRLGFEADLDTRIDREEVYVSRFGAVKEFKPHWRS